MIAIEARELRKTFPVRRGAPVEAVAGISFAVEAGERLAYIGPNGAGKSTSIKMLTGILHPTSAARIGTLFGQRSQLWYQLTPRQTFGLLGRIYRIPADEERRRLSRLGELLDATQLFDQPVRSLSLGQRMRCELVASMLHAPEVLFLDEPTIGLDLVAKSRFRDLIVRINEEQGTTILLTSHDVSDIEQVARRVIVINHGRLIYDDRVSVMRRALLGTKMLDVRFEQPPASVEVEGARLVKLTGAGAKLVVDTDQRPIRSVLDDLLDRYDVVDISVADPPLEEIVSHIYARPV
jgi:ABC-2 type transport system ATP-binding protein